MVHNTCPLGSLNIRRASNAFKFWCGRRCKAAGVSEGYSLQELQITTCDPFSCILVMGNGHNRPSLRHSNWCSWVLGPQHTGWSPTVTRVRGTEWIWINYSLGFKPDPERSWWGFEYNAVAEDEEVKQRNANSSNERQIWAPWYRRKESKAKQLLPISFTRTIPTLSCTLKECHCKCDVWYVTFPLNRCQLFHRLLLQKSQDAWVCGSSWSFSWRALERGNCLKNKLAPRRRRRLKHGMDHCLRSSISVSANLGVLDLWVFQSLRVADHYFYKGSGQIRRAKMVSL